jgi:hypothetical protein
VADLYIVQQLQRVKSCGGSQVQGYYFSKPVGADAMMALLKKDRVRPARPVVALEALAGWSQRVRFEETLSSLDIKNITIRGQ